MFKIVSIFFCLGIFSYSLAQNVGIGEANPTHTLHVTPFTPGDDPIRVSGLNLSNPNTDTSFVMFNNGNGVFKYIPFKTVLNQIIDSISNSNTFITNITNNILPAGEIHTFATTIPPNGYLECNGQAVSRTTYARLFSAIGTTYGAGDGSTTFNIPDYRGQFLRGYDNTSGTDLDAATRTDRGDGTTGDAVGTKQNNQTLAHNHTVNPPATNSNTTGSHLHTINPPSTTSNTTGNHLHTVNPPATNTNTTGAHTHSVDPPSATTSTNGNHTHTMPGYHLSAGGNQIPFYNWSNSNMANNTNTTSASGNHNHTLNIATFNSASSGNHAHSVNIAQFNSSTTGNHTHTTDIPAFNSSNTGNHSHTTDIATFNSGNNGGAETRPTNISVLWCIKF